MSAAFTHLHVHSEYSLADGAIRISDLIRKAKESGQSSIALTDHGNLYGAIEFYQKCKDEGLNPIIGAEIYAQTPLVDLENEENYEGLTQTPFHLVLLATSEPGYKNLVKIVSRGHLKKNHPDVPLVDFATIAKHSQDIIALSGCMLGEFGHWLQHAMKQEPTWDVSTPGKSPAFLALETYVKAMKSAFADRFYIELTNNNLPQQTQMLPHLNAAATLFDLPTVATCDAHYLEKEDDEAHAVLVGIKNEITVSQLRNRRKNARFDLRSNEDMATLFRDYPEALANTEIIAKACQIEFHFGQYFLPKFELDGDETIEDGLRRLAKEGLDARRPVIQAYYKETWQDSQWDTYEKRLAYELDVIIQMGFPGYFLIVQDFINWAKEQDIPVGPGRGSGAGSLVAYALRITDLDPIPFNLIFERFLNPERVSMPDFDIDFCQERRDEVIQYVTEKYGTECVAQITTFGRMLAKAAIRDVGRVLEIGYNRVDRVAKLIPNELGIKLKKAIEQEPKINEEARSNPMVADLLKLALKLEGLARHTSVHAAGVVISEGSMDQYVPVYRSEEGGLITQFEMKNAEKVGLVKFDFLGLKTLTVIHHAVKLIRASMQADFDISMVPLDDPKVYELISAAKSIGVFQLESPGMRQLLTKLQPGKFEDLVALVALFRPGPLGSGMVEDFIERKHGRQEIEYPHPLTEPILKETYGTIVYQEQVQKIAAVLANYSLGEADLLRRAMGKKKPEEMAKQKVRFVDGCKSNDIPEQQSTDLFDLMAKFAEYGFNKSHSAAYGLVSYHTAYLKTHYCEQFMAAIMTCDLDNTDKVVRYIEDCKQMNIAILPPNINESQLEFDVRGKKKIGFGLAAIKGLGNSPIRPLLEERDHAGPYTSLPQLAKRVNLAQVGKKNMETLIDAGALDCFGFSRPILRSIIADLVKLSDSHHRSKSQGQRSLFDDTSSEETQDDQSDEIVIPERSHKKFIPQKPNEILQREKKLLGTYLTGHPMDLFAEDVDCFGRCQIDDLPSMVDKGPIQVPCLLTDYFERTTRDGKRMMVLRMEDPSGNISPALFEGEFPEELPDPETPIIAMFKVTKSYDGQARVRLSSVTPLEQHRQQRVKALRIRVDTTACDNPRHIEGAVARLQELSQNEGTSGPNPTDVFLSLKLAQGDVDIETPQWRFHLDDETIQKLHNHKDLCPEFEYILGQAPALTEEQDSPTPAS